MKTLLKFVTVFFAAVISLPSFASNAGFKVISSKIEMSPGLKGEFVEKNSSSVNSMTTVGDAHAYARAIPTYGRKGENVQLKGEHSYIITNRSGKAQYYDVEYRLTLEDGRFIRKSDVVRIENNTVAKNDATSYSLQFYPLAGTYRFYVDTYVKGEYTDYSRDSGSVTIN